VSALVRKVLVLLFEVAVVEDTLNLIGQDPQIHDSLPTSSTTLSTYVLDSYRAREATIYEAILSAKSKINLTFDGWKAPNYLNFEGIVAHLLDSSYTHRHVLVGLPRIIGSKTGENEAAVIAPVLHKYGIGVHNLGATTSDNAGDNDTTVKVLQQLLGMLVK
jgi:hypothetical protein